MTDGAVVVVLAPRSVFTQWVRFEARRVASLRDGASLIDRWLIKMLNFKISWAKSFESIVHITIRLQPDCSNCPCRPQDWSKMSEGTPSSSLSDRVSRKRKRQTEESSQQNKTHIAPIHGSGGPSKKKRKRNRNKPAAGDVRNDDRGGGIDESIRKMDGRLLADYFCQQAKRHNKELTAMELNDLYVPGEIVASASEDFCLCNPNRKPCRTVLTLTGIRTCIPWYNNIRTVKDSGSVAKFSEDL